MLPRFTVLRLVQGDMMVAVVLNDDRMVVASVRLGVPFDQSLLMAVLTYLRGIGEVYIDQELYQWI